MQKRVADEQLTKLDSMTEDKRLNTGMSSSQPQRATAAQLAGRRLAKAKGVRRTPGRPSSGFGSAPAPAQSVQQSLPSFAQTLGVPSNGFSFGQSPSNDANGSVSASFPPFGNNANINTNTGMTSSFPAPSNNPFAASTAPVSNPFATMNVEPQQASKSSGFQGSIFSFQSPATPAFNPSGTAAQAPSTPAQTPSFGSLKQTVQPTPANNGFSWGAPTPSTGQNGTNLFQQSASTPAQQTPLFSTAQQQTQQGTPNLFGAASQQPQPQTPNLFGAVQQPQQQTPNLFAGFGKPSGQNGQEQSEAKSANPFANLPKGPTLPAQPPASDQASSSASGSQSVTTQQASQATSTPSTNLFAGFKTTPAATTPFSFGATKLEEASTSKSNATNMFAQSTIPAATAPSPFNPFASLTLPNQSQQLAPSLSQSETMQTSPDATPTKGHNESKAISQGGQSIIGTPGASGGGLFDRISKPEFAAPSPAKDQAVNGAAQASSAPNMFGQIPQHAASAEPTFAPPAANPFASLITPAVQSTPSVFTFGSSTVNEPAQGSSEQENQDQGPARVQTQTFTQATTHDDKLQPGDGSDARKAADVSVADQSSSIMQRALGDPPPHSKFYSPELRRHVYIGWRLKALDIGFHKFITEHNDFDAAALKRFYLCKKDHIMRAGIEDLEPITASMASVEDRITERNFQQSQHMANAGPSATTGSQKMAQTGLTNGPLQPLQHTNAKRKANDNTGEQSFDDSRKKARPQETANLSSTANLFSNILESNKTSTNNDFNHLHTSKTSPLKAPPANLFAPAPSSTSVNLSLPEAGSQASASRPTNSPFTFQPLTNGTKLDTPGAASGTSTVDAQSASQTSHTATPPAIKPPTFGNTSGTDFLSQFAAAAKKTEEKEKKKRKAESFDSDEDDEAEWERKDAEEQKQKKQKIEEAAQTAKKFVPKFGAPKSPVKTKAASTTRSPPKSIFEQMQSNAGQTLPPANLFSHLAQKPGEHESDGTADDEDDEDDADVGQPTQKADVNGSTEPRAKPTKDRSADPPKGDYTFDVNSPIKFGDGSKTPTAPALNVMSASPIKQPFTGLFGAMQQKTNSEPQAKAPSGLFASVAQPAPSASVGFAFGQTKSTDNTLSIPSGITSRASTPGATTGESATESNAERPEEDIEKHAQIDLMSQRTGEEDETVLFEVKAKAFALRKQPEGVSQWKSHGVGPLRVLKHRTTKATRIVLRTEPAGKVVVNSLITKEGEYKLVAGNAVTCPIVEENKIVPFQLKVGKADDQKKLQRVLEANQPK